MVQGTGESTALTGVLDWELCHLGDPLEDLGWLCVNAWRFGHPERVVGGFGSLEQLEQGYGQFDRERLRWWQVLGCAKWACITLSAAIAGRPSDPPID